jgi:hypothetical protein
MFRSATFELRGVEMVPIEKEFHGRFTTSGYTGATRPLFVT